MADHSMRAHAHPVDPSTASALKRVMLPLYLHRWRRGCAVLTLAALTVASGIALLGVSGWFLSGAALAGTLLTFNLFVPSAMIRAFSFVRIGSRYAERLVGHNLTLQLLADLRARVFRHLLQRSPRQLAALGQGDAVSGLTADIDALDAVFLTVVVPLAVALGMGAVFASVWARFAPYAAASVGFATVMVAVVIPLMALRLAYAHGARAQRQWSRARDEVFGTIQGHADLVALDALGAAHARFATAIDEAGQGRLAQSVAAAGGQALLHAIAGLCVLACLASGLVAWQAGAITGPVLAGMVLATMGFFEVAAPIVRGAARLGAAKAAAARVSTLLDTDCDLPVCEAPLALPRQGDLVLEHVSFAYPTAHARPVLSEVSLRIGQGEHVVFTGESGSGKSTLLQLMMRLHDPDTGRVAFAACDLKQCDPGDVYARMALLTQDAPLFLGSVRTNLQIGAPEADDDRLWAALDHARLGDYVRGLDEGLDTWVGETGWRLSAGQARRLCLARVWISDAEVILLDEPTAGLDAANEHAYFEALAASARGRTLVIATHAAVPPLQFDRTYIVEQGRVRTQSQ